MPYCLLDVMEKLDLPYHQINIDRLVIESVYSAISKKSAESPHNPVSLLSISNELKIDQALVKEIFMILYLYGYMKASFLPRCRSCDKVVGRDEESVETIYEKADNGDYGYCVGCTNLVGHKDDLEIELLFWLPQYAD